VTIEPGTIDVIEIVVALAVKIPLGLFILRWDEKRLAKREPERLERAWPPATRLSSIVVFQELGVWIHFWKTRGWLSPRGFFLGLCVAAAYVTAASVVLEGVDMLLRPEG
jgi:hypothetical protein